MGESQKHEIVALLLLPQLGLAWRAESLELFTSVLPLHVNM